MGKKLKIIVPVALIAVAVVLLFSLLFGNGYKKPIKNLFEALNEEDADIYYEDVVPEFFEKKAKNSSESYKKDLEESIKSYKKSFKKTLGSDIEYSYKIIDQIKLDDDELESAQKSIKARYDKKVEVKKGYSVAVKITIEGSDDEKETFETFKVLKLEDDGWCLVNGYTGFGYDYSYSYDDYDE